MDSTSWALGPDYARPRSMDLKGRAMNKRGWNAGLLVAGVVAATLSGCASESSARQGKTRVIRSTPDFCDPGAVSLMNDWRIRSGMQAKVLFMTTGPQKQAAKLVRASEGAVDLVLQERLGELPAGTLLAGWATYGYDTDSGGGSTTPTRLLVNVMGFQLPGMKFVFPACMRVTRDGQWGALLVDDDEEGSLVLTAAHVEAVDTFDKSRAPSKPSEPPHR